MCERLVDAGHRVSAFDISDRALRGAKRSGAVPAASAADAAANADVIFTCLPSPQAVVDAIAGKDGVFAGARRGAVVTDLSTNDPHVVRELARQAQERDIRFADAPVSGGVPRARNGTLTIMVGSTADDFETIEPILTCLGSRVFHIGPVGCGNVAKLANNLIAMCNLATAYEGFMAVKRHGIAPETFLSVLEVSSGASAVLPLMKTKVLTGDFDPDFTLDMAYKDARLALEVGEKGGVPMSFGTLLKLQLEQARARGYGADDVTSVVRVLEDTMSDAVRAGRDKQPLAAKRKK